MEARSEMALLAQKISSMSIQAVALDHNHRDLILQNDEGDRGRVPQGRIMILMANIMIFRKV